jgi:hypothetical protein
LFTIAVERAELSEKGNQGTFTEAVVDGGVESKCGELLAKVAYPGGSNLGRNKIDLVEDEDQMLVRCLSTDVLFDGAATGSIRITGV